MALTSIVAAEQAGHDRSDQLVSLTDNNTPADQVPSSPALESIQMQRLTDASTWAKRHSTQQLPSSQAYKIPKTFREQHALFQRMLPTGPGVRMLEIGCFPGGFLEYFHRILGHTVTGLEYVRSSCETCRTMLESRHIPATIIHGDLFKDDWNTEIASWDIVFSAGLIEHFDDSSPAIERHLQLVAPGGHCVITLPNHSGLNGRILKTINRPLWELHNRMDAIQVRRAFERSPSCERFELLCCHYVEHIGLWNCGVYESLNKLGRSAYLPGRGLGKIAEASLRWLPNTRLLSPNIIMVAKAR